MHSYQISETAENKFFQCSYMVTQNVAHFTNVLWCYCIPLAFTHFLQEGHSMSSGLVDVGTLSLIWLYLTNTRCGEQGPVTSKRLVKGSHME